jgi:putative transposase
VITWFRENIQTTGVSIESLYSVSGIKRQVYFRQLKRMEKQIFIETRTIEMVKEVRTRHANMGARPLYYLLNISHMGINQFEQLLSNNHLGIPRKRLWIKTTNSNHNYFKYDNLTNGMRINGINQLWVSDITYWIIEETHYYLSFIMDVYSRRILGYTVSLDMYAVNNLKILKASLEKRNKPIIEGLVHHSDKGSQYCSTEYVRALVMAKIRISMAKSSIENPYAERLNGIIKNDYLKTFDTSSFARLKKSLDWSVWLYNNERPHSELGYITPVSYEEIVEKQSMENRKVMVLHDFTKGNSSAPPPVAAGGG